MSFPQKTRTTVWKPPLTDPWFVPPPWFEGKQKGGFVKGRFGRICPRSGFWYRGTSACTLVLVLGSGEHPKVPSVRFLVPGNIRRNDPFGNHSVLRTPDRCRFSASLVQKSLPDSAHQKSFWRSPKIFVWRVRCLVRFPLPIRFACTPPIF